MDSEHSRSKPRSPDSRSMWSRLDLLLGDRRAAVMWLAISSVLSGFAEAAILAVLAEVANGLVGGTTHVHVSLGPLHRDVTVGALLAFAFVLALIRLALQGAISYLPALITAEVQARLRRTLFDAFTRASWAVQSQDREGHLQEMMTSQVVQASAGALQATTLVSVLLTFAVLVISALALNAGAAIVVIIAAVLLFGLLRPLNAIGARRARSLSEAQMSYAGGIGESIRVAEETQVFGVAETQRKRIGALIGTARELFYSTQFIGRLIPNVYQSLIYLLLVAGLAVLYATKSGDFASLGAVVLLLVRAGTYGQQIQGSYQFVRQALPFVERLQEAEQRYVESMGDIGTEPLSSVETLAFEHVSFAYSSDRPVLSDISFTTSRGEAIGVIGPSGAGKSTLVQILLQLRAPEEGRYLVNGASVTQFKSDDWQHRVAYVPQEPRLVHASVAENIRYFRDLSDESVERAGKLARIHDDIVAWPKGYDTIVGPRANAVSGGQQQRICLARALAARPEVLVLDEPTSALDPRSEALIQESLIALKGSITLFIIAHRMSTLDMCDRVMVILDGNLDAFDTIDALREHNQYYRSAAPLATGLARGASL